MTCDVEVLAQSVIESIGGLACLGAAAFFLRANILGWRQGNEGEAVASGMSFTITIVLACCWIYGGVPELVGALSRCN